MSLLKTFIPNPKDTCFYGEDKDEKILYIIRSSLLTTIPWLFLTFVFGILPFFVMPYLASLSSQHPGSINWVFVSLFLVFWYLFTIGWFIQNYLLWFFNIYIISNKRIIDMDFKGLLYKNISETPLANVEDATSNVKGLFGIVFNIGDVLVQTAAEENEFEFSSVDDPSKIRDIISDMIARSAHGHS